MMIDTIVRTAESFFYLLLVPFCFYCRWLYFETSANRHSFVAVIKRFSYLTKFTSFSHLV
jgi:hypothetical protein